VYAGFHDESANNVQDALNFAKSSIQKFRQQQKLRVDKAHHSLIDKEIQSVLDDIGSVEVLLTKAFVELDVKTHEQLMDIIRSALEIYLRDTLEVKSRLGLVGFDERIQEIRRIISLDSLKDRKVDLFEKYYKPLTRSPEGGKVEVFFSYSHEDRALAGKIATILKGKELDVFLAHEDMEVSKEWRDQIFEHLKACKVLLALLTSNFEKSVWANQETGYMQGKGGKIVPLMVQGVDIKRFGFLEALQGITVNESDLWNVAEQIVKTILET
jgi:hypothetical protein